MTERNKDVDHGFICHGVGKTEFGTLSRSMHRDRVEDLNGSVEVFLDATVRVDQSGPVNTLNLDGLVRNQASENVFH